MKSPQATGNYILAIESAVRGGSIAVLGGGIVISSICGNESVSRAEDLLPNIKRLLADTGIGKEELGTISVSRGPGSFTGIRIGIATAMGLARSLGITAIGIPLLEAIAAEYSGFRPLAAAVPIGKSDVAFGIYPKNGSADSDASGKVVNAEELLPVVEGSPAETVFLHKDLYLRLGCDRLKGRKYVDIGTDMAAIIGKQAPVWAEKNDLSPIYLQNPARSGSLF